MAVCSIALLVSTGAASAEDLPAPAKAPVIADLAWLAGHWMRTEEGTRMEEGWFGPAGGIMLGLHRDVAPAGKVAFEFLRIAETAYGIVYFASPGGRPATAFPLKTIEANRAVFENQEHDFPQRILYWRDGAMLHARIEGTIDGQPKSDEWAWDLQP
jgi:hypothetical protein